MSNLAKLVSIATAVPPFIIDQGQAAAAARDEFGARYADFKRLRTVFENSGILRRRTVRPLEWYLQPLGWPERNAVYLESACGLFLAAAEKALGAAALSAAEIDTILTVSSTGIATPSIEARVHGAMGFRADVERVPIFGLGCAGGVTGLSIAARLARSRPGSNVLMVAIELCSLAFRLDKLTKANIVSSAIFADGAAACVLRAGDHGIATIEMDGQYTWPDTLDIMGWTADREGLGVILDRDVPSFAERHLSPAVKAIVERGGLKMTDFDRLTFHPGGAKVIEALEGAFAIGQGALDHERAILAEYGNMSAPTALFILERLIGAGLPPRTLLTAMGPGFTASCVSLKRID